MAELEIERHKRNSQPGLPSILLSFMAICTSILVFFGSVSVEPQERGRSSLFFILILVLWAAVAYVAGFLKDIRYDNGQIDELRLKLETINELLEQKQRKRIKARKIRVTHKRPMHK